MPLSDARIDPQSFHVMLANFNRSRTSIGFPQQNWEECESAGLKMRILEGRFLEDLRSSVAPLAHDVPADAAEFVSWFESLMEWGPGQYHPLFDWLASQANTEQLKWFLTQEAAGEAGFDDLVAYTQVKLPAQAKLECARNYWDEMGRGKRKAMHGPLLEAMVHELGLTPSIKSTVWESLALANTMLGLATSRRYTYQSLGALGVIELTAPWRAAKVSLAMRRLDFPRRSRSYFDLHAVIDVRHACGWIGEVIKPLVEENPECARHIAEGALMRLRCGQLCFDRYTRELQPAFSARVGKSAANAEPVNVWSAA